MRIITFFVLFTSAVALRICHHNDFHARYAEIHEKSYTYCDKTVEDPRECFSSIARVKAAMDGAECDLRIHAGDMMQGSVFDVVFKTDIAVDAYNSVGYDMAVVGNHEFDHGRKPLFDTIKQTPNVSWILSNIKFLNMADDLPVTKHVESHGICWVSALTPTTTSTSNSGPNVKISDAKRGIIRSMKSCSQKKSVVAITHVGFDEDVKLCNSIKRLDLIIGGHSHTDLQKPGYSYPTRIVREDGSVCFIVTAACCGKYLGVVDVSFKKGKMQVNEAKSGYLPLDINVPFDNDLAIKIAIYATKLEKDPELGRIVAELTTDLAYDTCRIEECQMGNLVADALWTRASTQEAVVNAKMQDKVICILNGGSIRAAIKQGEVSIRDLLSVFPFGNVHRLIKISGAGLKSALEVTFGTTAKPRVGQLANMEVTIDRAATPMVKKVFIGGKPIIDDDYYLVVTNDYIAENHSGYNWQEWGGVVDPFEYVKDAIFELVADYLSDNNPYTPPVIGDRVKDITESTSEQCDGVCEA